MKVLVIGSGGREHALVWKLKQSPLVKKIYAAPGNPGTAAIAENVPIDSLDAGRLKDFALKNKIDLTIVGPEAPLALGLCDLFRTNKLAVFGPSKKAAQLEASKVFAKSLMVKYDIPTADYRAFDALDEAVRHVKQGKPPFVIKADGLAGGKGVIICKETDEAVVALNAMMSGAGRVLIEEFLEGEEASFLAITDGRAIAPLAPAQDHKTIFDGDKGPNTGGMGAYSPARIVTPAIEKEIMQTIIRPVVDALQSEYIPFCGVIYAGLMIVNGRPKTLEFNARFGDPETQPILMRLDEDLAGLLLLAAQGRLRERPLRWKDNASACVVMASEGYPGEYTKGAEITGIKEAEAEENVKVFHAGTAMKDGKLVTAGGRVLGVTAQGHGLREAVDAAYKAVEKIHFKGAQFRRDIGKKGL
ncbi:MAG: phosphoribosylamine--glycine ligase [Deltaproteobacteria bacterium]|nr:phosphoribosylamine--glycine ligase [Deltaproteobacteria bacterium]